MRWKHMGYWKNMNNGRTDSCSVNKKNRIALICVYLGKLPDWMDLYMESCRFNSHIADFFIFTDNPPGFRSAGNVKIFRTDLKDINFRFSACLNLEVNIKRVYKLCDFRPIFGIAFREFLEGYDFWGMTDIDLLYGDIQSFITDEYLNQYDVISADEQRLCGPLTIFRNCDYVNELFRKNEHSNEIFTKEENAIFDENGFTDIIKQEAEHGNLKYLFGNFQRWRTEYLLPATWNRGKVTSASNNEVMFIHFDVFKARPKKIIRFCKEVNEIFYTGNILYILQESRRLRNALIRARGHIYHRIRRLVYPPMRSAKRLIFGTRYKVPDFKRS
jgi:hypothetical protein